MSLELFCHRQHVWLHLQGRFGATHLGTPVSVANTLSGLVCPLGTARLPQAGIQTAGCLANVCTFSREESDKKCILRVLFENSTQQHFSTCSGLIFSVFWRRACMLVLHWVRNWSTPWFYTLDRRCWRAWQTSPRTKSSRRLTNGSRKRWKHWKRR